MNSSVDKQRARAYGGSAAKKKNPAAVALGRMGGKAIAERGPEYFRKLQAKRRKRRGGRPRQT